MNKGSSSSQFFKGTIILTIAAVFTKILSAVYRIPYQNIAGDIGFYIYQQVYPFYGIAVTLATYGFPVAISKLMAERRQSDKTIFLAALLWLGGLGVFLFLSLYVGADYIAKVMGDPLVSPLLRIVSFSFLLMPFISVTRGYFQASGHMVPTATSQTIEQTVRVVAILISTYMLVGKGYSLYIVGEGALYGSLAGGVAATLLLAGYLLRLNSLNTMGFNPLSKTTIYQVGAALLIQGMAYCISSLFLLLLQVIDALQLYALLLEQGMMPEEAKQWKGVFDRGQPLIQVGAIVSTSLALSIVPILTHLVRTKNSEEVKKYTTQAIRISVGIGLGASIGLIGILKPTNHMLFTDTKGTGALMIMAAGIFFAALIITGAAILQTVGHTKVSVSVLLLGVVIKYSGNLLLIPSFGINGASVATLVTLVICSSFIYRLLKKRVANRIFSLADIKALFSAGIAMWSLLFLYGKAFDWITSQVGTTRIMSTVHALTAVILGAVVYLILSIRLRYFTEKELRFLPFGSKLLLFVPRRK